MDNLFINDSDINKNNPVSLMATVIGGGKVTDTSYNIARNICRYFKEPCDKGINYKKLASTNAEELLRIDGIGPKRANFICAVLELTNKIHSYNGFAPSVSTPDDVFTLMNDMKYLRHEEFRVILLNSKNKVIDVKVISKGILDASLVHPREVFKTAIDSLASSIILVHNHPSGNPTPSRHDIEITDNIVAAGKIMDIDVTDHIVIGDKGYVSMREKHFI